MGVVPETQVEIKGSSRAAESLLGLVQELVAELRPQQARQAVSLDSVLDRELGLDSLASLELLLRVERQFDVHLPDTLLSVMETPRDILRAVLGAEAVMPETLAGHRVNVPVPGAAGEPAEAATLIEVLDWHAGRHPEQTHILLCEQEGQREITYNDLLEGARSVSAGLSGLDIEPGQAVAIMLPTGREFFFGFYGVLLAGAVPVPIYPPVRLRQIEEHMRRQAGILSNAQARMLITFDEAKPLTRLLKSGVDTLRAVVTVDELSRSGARHARLAMQAQDIALLQYTSGSTGDPKGVVLTHANLLANIRAMGQATGANAGDVFVSWLPLYHDMGLIGACMGSLYYGLPLILMSPLNFIARPQRWLWAISNHHGTLSPAPNFAYELCLRAMDDDIKGLDLSSWRMAFNGAEPVSPDTIERFSARFSTYGFRRESLTPVYGLAESSVGLAFPPMDRGPVVDRIKRETLARQGKAVPADMDDANALQFVACGRPLPGHQIRIVDGAGREVAEREEGRLQFTGPSVTSGYFHNPEATAELYQGDWLDSGDFAYIAGGDIYLTGRAKDIIIRAGRNIYPQELEDAVGSIPRIRKGCVAAFASRDLESGTERLVILAETRERGPEKMDALRQQINELAVELLGTPPDEVVLAPPNTVLKTSSGKIRRAASREVYERGDIGGARPSVRWQLLRLAMAAAIPQLRRGMRNAGKVLYAGYAWALFLLMATGVWLSVIYLPNLAWRRRFVRAAARLFLRLAGVSLMVRGLEHLPRGRPFVLVANHASYLDGIMLSAALPAGLIYVVKREVEAQFVPRVFLRRIGAEYVDRLDAQRGAEDTARLRDAVHEGQSLVILPEGTFDRAPGLMPFHMGAFMVAARAGAPVVPAAIRGTRSMLRADSWFPRRGVVGIVIDAPITPEGAEWSAAVSLRDRARRDIAHHCGEPDLLA